MEALNQSATAKIHGEPNQAVFTDDGKRKLCFGGYLVMKMTDHKFLQKRSEAVYADPEAQKIDGRHFRVVRVVDTEPQVALRMGLDPEKDSVKKEQRRDIELYRQIAHDNIAPLLAVVPNTKIEGLVEVFPLYDSDLLSYVEKNHYQLKDIQCWMLQVCNALKFLHDKMIVHSDIKPENILFKLVNDQQKIAVTDLGWAGEVGTTFCSATSNCAPEVSSFWWQEDYSRFSLVADVSQLKKEKKRHCVNDVWSLGFTIRLLVDYFDRDGRERNTIRDFLEGKPSGDLKHIETLIDKLVLWTSKSRGNAYCQVEDTREARSAMRMLLMLTQNTMTPDPAKRFVIQETENVLKALPTRTE